MIEIVFQPFVNGILLGSIYAAFSVGLALIFGVMNIINFAHGEFVMLGAFTSYWLFKFAHIDPFLTISIILPLFFAFGYLLQRVIINRVLGAPILMTLALLFGISLILRYSALYAWGTEYRLITTAWTGANLTLGGLTIPLTRLVAFALSFTVIVSLFLFLQKTKLGTAIRATAQDKEAARLIGINIKKVQAFTFGIGSALTAIGGSFIAPLHSIYPNMGFMYTLFAFFVVVLGGMGNLVGALWGGLTLGLLESLTGSFLGGQYVYLIIFGFLYGILIIRRRASWAEEL